jgi:hypothetical protein
MEIMTVAVGEANYLDLDDLSHGRPALTPAQGKTFAEAASVCLEENGHPEEMPLKVSGDYRLTVHLKRCIVTDQIRRTHNDLEYAKEWGAYGISILVVQSTEGYTVIERSVKGLGFDYWLGRDDDPLFLKMARLEVTGTFKSSDGDLDRKVDEKLRQIEPSDGTYPGFVSVVSYRGPEVRLVRKK